MAYPDIESAVEADLDLGELNKAIGLKTVELKDCTNWILKPRQYRKEQDPRKV